MVVGQPLRAAENAAKSQVLKERTRMHRRLMLLVLLSPLTALAAPCVTASFPGYSWPSRTKEVSEAKKAEITALEDYAFTLTGKDEERKGIRTDSVVIIKGGQIIYEKYARGWDELKPHISWSVAKSVTSALTGVAVQRGLLKIDESVCQVLEGQTEKVCKITPHHLLEFGSGIDWQEEYEDQTYQVSSVISMLFGEGHRDMLSFILGHRTYAEPGVKWRYSTAESTVLAAVAKGALQPQLGKDWAWRGLFDLLGMRGVFLEEDAKGTPLGGSHVFATSRDYARFGYLYLQDGCWNGTRVLPEDWVTRSTQPSAPFVSSAGENEKTPNGWMWWLNKAAGPAKEKPWPDAPDDAYSAIGHWGQYVVVVPSADVVIVRTGDDRSSGISLAKLIPLALEVAK
jgi:CubicO group peptidase (beta-lactamase class C family)